MRRLTNIMNQRGFTLLELVIITAIIGVLATTAVSQFSSYRAKSFNSAAESDLRNGATSQESFYLDNDTYSNAVAGLQVPPYFLYISEGVNMTVAAADVVGYTMQAYHSNGTRTYTLSGPGGSISD